MLLLTRILRFSIKPSEYKALVKATTDRDIVHFNSAVAKDNESADEFILASETVVRFVQGTRLYRRGGISIKAKRGHE